MKERGYGVLVVVVVVMVVKVNEITAKPTALRDTPLSNEGNHVHDQYLDDALGNWLDNFGTYTFMVKQDLDSHPADADEGADEGGEEDTDEEADEGGDEGGDEEGGEGQKLSVDVHEVEVEEGTAEEVREEEWSAPIAVSTGPTALLNPHHDYLVTVESLVAENGSIFITLSKFENQTSCGVGGLTLEEEMKKASRSGGGNVNVARGIRSSNEDTTTFIAFGLQQDNTTTTATSGWITVSEQYWWASGQLSGGSMLSITFTPPECGCLALSTYFALPVGNLTLVVGPQAYPDELQTLLCVDPLPADPDQEVGDEEEEEEEEEAQEEEVVYLQKPSALVASIDLGEDENVAEVGQAQEQPTVSLNKRKTRKEKKMAKKTRRQMKRQRIRQAGRRQARQQGRQQDQTDGAGRTGRRWNHKKNQRRRTRVWKRLNKKGRQTKQGKHHHHHHHDGVNGTASENMTQDHQHHHPGHHKAAFQQEERLVDILLRPLASGNSTVEEENEESAAGEGEEGEGADAMMEEEEEEEEGEGEEEAQTPRERRINRRQRKKKMRKQRRKVYPPGVKFCCKQGVKHKKNILELNSTTGSCDMSMDVVSTFANHQFGIEEDACTTTFTTCCGRLTQEMWESIKANKKALKTARKQLRKSRRQDRKQRRKQGRRQRGHKRRQARFV